MSSPLLRRPRRLEVGIVIGRLPEEVFAWLSDYRHAARALDGVRRWEPLGKRTRGVGTRFAVEMATLGFAVATELEIDRWEVPSTLGWHAVGGPVRVQGLWRLEPHPAGTDVRLAIDYEPPGGALGALGARSLERIGRHRLHSGLEVMRDALEDEDHRH
ncbi:MAG: SRPBCC family protein [Candidatus Dormiibacterota bacterium]